jgi:hypothetical protein
MHNAVTSHHIHQDSLPKGRLSGDWIIPCQLECLSPIVERTRKVPKGMV